MEDLVVERVRPARRTVLVHRHRRVVREVKVVQHLEHLVATDRQERCAHTAHILQLDATVRGQDLALAGNLAGPLLRRERFTEAVTVCGEKQKKKEERSVQNIPRKHAAHFSSPQDHLRNGVRCHLVSVGVQVLHLAVIGPLVRHVERGRDRAAVRVDPSPLEQVLVQLLVQIVDGIVERQQHDLRHLLNGQLAGHILAAAGAIGQQAHILAALGGRLVGRRLRV